MNIKSEKNVDWLLICQHCRLEKCREAGMKDDYVHNLRLHVSLYQTIPKNEKKIIVGKLQSASIILVGEP